MHHRALTMKLKPGCAAEYQRRHDELWPELAALLRDSGISDYSNFLDDMSLTLFAVMKVSDPARLNGLPTHPVMRKWWRYMADLMETHPDQSPRETPLRQVFYLA